MKERPAVGHRHAVRVREVELELRVGVRVIERVGDVVQARVGETAAA